MKLSNIELGTAGFLCLLVGCGGNTPMSVGAKDGHCTAGGGCDPGLICVSGQCASPADSAIGPSGSGAGGSGGASGSGGADGNTGAGGQGGDDGRYGIGGDGGSNIGEAGGSVPVGFCTGVPRACALYGDESTCEVVGCSWSALSPIPSCDGMGSPCTTLGTDSCALAGCTWHLGTPPDAALGGGPGAGGAAGRGGGGSLGGGGSGGVTMTGGMKAAGGTGGTGGSSSAGGDSCSNVVPCGGDVVGTWTVTSSCLSVSGQLDMSMLGMSCASAPVVGSLQVTGTWTARSDGTYQDATTTFGSEQITLPASCLVISSAPVSCGAMASLLLALGYSTVSCSPLASEECACAATIVQDGGLGQISPYAQTSGEYTTSGNVVTTDEPAHYSYCVAGNRMTWTPQSTSPTTTGTIVFQQGGVGGSGGGGSGGSGSGGASGTGGARATGGATGTGGSTGSGGANTFAIGPCDIYATDGGPCVAAHSTVRRLSSTYFGPLYQVRVGGSKSGTGGTTSDIGFLADGFADASTQDAVCGADLCTISTIYDQSGLGNHLTVAPPGGNKTTGDNEANAKALPITIGGHTVYGVHVVPGIGYRNNAATGTATGDNPETIYMIASRDFYNSGCCFDYGNVETNSRDNGEGAAEAVYFGSCTIWNKGGGDGPIGINPIPLRDVAGT